ncbi:hypothetical protein GBA52_028988 [Prunus armeniaca]|nr:hypothetical protein GBA52_028988 [Prunus armeniaca]
MAAKFALGRSQWQVHSHPQRRESTESLTGSKRARGPYTPSFSTSSTLATSTSSPQSVAIGFVALAL